MVIISVSTPVLPIRAYLREHFVGELYSRKRYRLQWVVSVSEISKTPTLGHGKRNEYEDSIARGLLCHPPLVSTGTLSYSRAGTVGRMEELIAGNGEGERDLKYSARAPARLL